MSSSSSPAVDFVIQLRLQNVEVVGVHLQVVLKPGSVVGGVCRVDVHHGYLLLQMLTLQLSFLRPLLGCNVEGENLLKGSNRLIIRHLNV